MQLEIISVTISNFYQTLVKITTTQSKIPYLPDYYEFEKFEKVLLKCQIFIHFYQLKIKVLLISQKVSTEMSKFFLCHCNACLWWGHHLLWHDLGLRIDGKGFTIMLISLWGNMGKFVAIRNRDFGVLKCCIRGVLGFVLIIFFVQIFKRGEMKEFNIDKLNSYLQK